MGFNVFEVGLTVSIETTYKYYLTTRLIGWVRDEYIITDVVYSRDRRPALKANDTCKLRFLKDGVAYGFEATILSVILSPYPMMFLKYPKSLEQFTVRKFNRVKADLQACLLDDQENRISEATITNISAGGCGVNIPEGENQNLTDKGLYRVAFSILETDMRLPCVIRKMRMEKGVCCLGLEFCNISEREKEKINLFLDVCSNILTSRTDQIISKLKMSGGALAGRIEDLLIVDILQVLDQLKKEGALHIALGERKGMISIKNGQMMDAVLDTLSAEDALVAFFSLKQGAFQFYAQGVSSGRIKKPIGFILMEICRLMDEREEMADFCPDENDRLTLVRAPEDSDPFVSVIVNAFQGGTPCLSELRHATGLSLIRLVLLVARLIKDGFMIRSA